MNNLKIGTFNVRGLRNNKKRQKIFKYLHSKKYDIVLLQETHSTPEVERSWRIQWGGEIIYSHGTNLAKGNMILLKRNITVNVDKTIVDDEGRWSSVCLNTENAKIILMNIYAPNVDDVGFFNKVHEVIKKLQEDMVREIIIGGDFNLVLNIEKDILGDKSYTHMLSQHKVLDMIDEEQLVDIWRAKNEDKQLYTWKRENPKMLKERLDFFLVSKTLMNKIGYVDIDPSYNSDHSIPWLILKPDEISKGRGLWKLNTSLLDNADYVKEVTEIISEGKKGSDSPIAKWDKIKYQVRKFTRKFATRAKASQENILQVIDKKIKYFEIN